MQIRKLHQVAARLDEVAQTRTFYEETLGANYLAQFDPPGLLFFEFSGTRVLFEAGNDPATLYFWVDDIEQAHASLSAKGVQFESEPHRIHVDETGIFGQPGAEEWMAFFKDPSGNTIALATQKRQNKGDGT